MSVIAAAIVIKIERMSDAQQLCLEKRVNARVFSGGFQGQRLVIGTVPEVA